jgi:RHS repeat-associated protein
VAEDGQAVLNQTRENNKANEILSTTEAEGQTQWAQPEYDGRGNMITVPKPNSPASAFTCTWDAWNRLIQVKDGETVVATYAYDGLNHRITKTVGETIRHAYYNAGWQLLETRKTTDPEAHPETLNPEFQFVWSVRYIDALVLRDENKNGDGDCTDPEDQRLFFTNDANMNVTALLDTDGTVLERYAYTPYGKPSFFDASWNPRAESAYDNAILYCGYFYDSETGLYSVRQRYYHSSLGRFVMRDAAEEEANLYEYVRSRPSIARDPMGLGWYIGSTNYTGEVGQKVMGAIAGLAPEGYEYVEVFGLRKVRENLEWAAKQIQYKWSVLVAKHIYGAAAMYSQFYDLMAITESAPDATLVHEAVHAYDDKKDIYLVWPGPKWEKAEALASAMGALYRRLGDFKELEDKLKKEKDNREFTCEYWRDFWLGRWISLVNVYTDKVTWVDYGFLAEDVWRLPSSHTRNLAPADIEDVERRLEFNITCEELVKKYNALMTSYNIPDESRPGNCCTFECPTSPDLGPFRD